MAKRSKRRNRRRSTRNSLRRFTNSRFLLLLVLLAVLVFGSYLILQSSQVRSVLGIALANSTPVGSPATPTRVLPPATTTPSPAAQSTPVRVEPSWKDYSSPTHGYALKYPPNVVYREWTPAQDILQSVSFYLEKDSSLPPFQVPEVTVSIFANPQSQDTNQWFAAHVKPMEGSAALFAGVQDQQTKTVDGLEALSFEEKPTGPVSAHRILLARDNRIFSILVTDFGDASLRGIYWAMVSTLRWSAPRP